MTVMGRDNIADLIDSSVPDGAKTIETPITLKALCEKVIAELGADIEVENLVSSITDLDENTEIVADSGRLCMDFLVDFARKKQVYLVTDGNGKLQIFRPLQLAAITPLINREGDPRNNVIAFEKRINNQNRFNTYRVSSQDNFGTFDDADYAGGGIDRKGTSTDNQIRKSRFLEIQGEETMDDDESIDRAKEEKNIRHARSMEYEATVQGVRDGNVSIWDFGLRVVVDDEVADVSGIFVIRAVEYNVNINTGTRTTITCARIEAYQVRDRTQQDDRTSDDGDAFQLDAPDTEEKFDRPL